jgi:hypothetical protein
MNRKPEPADEGNFSAEMQDIMKVDVTVAILAQACGRPIRTWVQLALKPSISAV